MRRNLITRLAATALALLGSACSSWQPETAYSTAQPATRPVQNITSFTPALDCMDDLFASFGVKNVVITSAGIPDATSEVKAGTKDMLISAMSRMSVKSHAFAFVDFDQTQTDVALLQQIAGFSKKFVAPSYYIRGAITQLDSGVISNQVGAGLSVSGVDLGISKDLVVSVVSVDLNLGYLASRQIMPGISANNSVAVSRSGVGGDVGAKIGKAGVSFNLNMNKSEGMHSAVRSLIELSVIEISGKLAQVPYWRCLSIEQTNPEMVAEAKSWYDAMSPQERVVFTQRALASKGYYSGAINGIYDGSTKAASARYQADHMLIADGRLDFQLYQSLINADLALGQKPAPVEPIAAKDTAPAPLAIDLVTPKGKTPVFKVQDLLKMTVTSSQDAFVYCYYRDHNGTIARIFPNRFQPDPYAIAGRAFAVPSENSNFDIVFDTPGVDEEAICLASHKEIGLTLPANLKTGDLTPLPVASIDELVATFKQIDPAGLVQARLPLKVSN
jgi:peptidoglycan hydrolase-like protein with peptidoglycan-binding domain/curli biogenesis system outer membrane secretion channel CsgG